MKKLLLVCIAAVALTASSCAAKSANANLTVGVSSAIESSEQVQGEVLYRGYSYTIIRIRVDGVPYLVNSQGGIVKE